MAEHKSPIDQALDLLLYAPLGAALVARDELPRLIERGRTQVTAQVMLAKMMGQFAVTQGQKELKKRAERLMAQAGDAAERMAARPAPTSSAPFTSAPSPRGTNGAQTGGAAAGAASAASPLDSGPVGELAIPGYDSLSASQVVQRLGGLSGTELEAVRRYEAATRSRRTILSKVSQLQSGN